MLPSIGQIFFSFIAGLLTTLSPCVLPILPFVVGGAFQENVFAPLFLSGGLVASFVTIGWSLAAFGTLMGLEASNLRVIAGIGLALAGLFLVVPFFADKLTQVLTPLAGRADHALKTGPKRGLFGNFITGLLLGAVWSPCCGPTLGSAIAMASNEGAGIKSGIMMMSFGIGAVMPLLAMSYGAKGILVSNRSRILNAVSISKKIFGVLMIVVGLTASLGWDKQIEAFLVDRMSNSWVDLISKF